MSRPVRPASLVAVGALAASVLAVSLAVPVAQAVPTWLPVEPLSGPSVQDVQVVLDDHGNATAVWCSNEADSVVQTSSRPAGADWSPAVDLGAGCFPKLVLTPDGRVTAVWTVFEDPDSHLQWSTKPALGSWTAAAGLFEGPHSVESLALAADPAGNLTVVFVGPTATGDIVRATSRPAGGSWSEPGDLTDDDTHANPVVVADRDGRVTAAWQDADHVWATTRALVGGVWTVPDDIGPGGSSSLGVDSTGSVSIAWDSPGGVIATRRRPVGGVWSSVDTLDTGGSTAGGPALAVAPSGAAVVAWSSAAGISTEFIPYAAHRPAGTNDFSEAVPLDDPEHTTGGFDVAASGADRFLVAWDEGTMISPNHVKAARLSNGAWSAAMTLTIPDQGFRPEVALNRSGDGVVAFAGNFADGRLAQAVGLDVAGPAVSKLRVRRGVAPRTRAAFSVAALDTWSGVASYRWKFGDGRTANGRSVKHAFDKVGRYIVTLTMRDGVGNVTRRKRIIEVRPRPVIKVFALADSTVALGEKTVLTVRLNTKATVMLVLKGQTKGVRAVLKKDLPKGTSRVVVKTIVGSVVLAPDTYVITGTATNKTGTSPAKKINVKVVR